MKLFKDTNGEYFNFDHILAFTTWWDRVYKNYSIRLTTNVMGDDNSIKKIYLADEFKTKEEAQKRLDEIINQVSE